MHLLKLVPEVIIDYICDFLCLCQNCFKRVYKDQTLSCNHCKRHWCNNCKPLDKILKHVFDRASKKNVHVCAWCLREQKHILNQN